MQVGGVPAVLKYLLQKGFLHGDCLTVTGVSQLQSQSQSQPQVRLCALAALQCSPLQVTNQHLAALVYMWRLRV